MYLILYSSNTYYLPIPLAYTWTGIKQTNPEVEASAKCKSDWKFNSIPFSWWYKENSDRFGELQMNTFFNLEWIQSFFL